MIPVHLKLSNFLSYGASGQSLDFSRFHVACLSGKNGQGKSALLDAITWVLWGEARKSTGSHKPDEELLRKGSLRMRVEFVFEVEGEKYRVMRSYSRSSSGKTNKSELEFQLIGASDGLSIPLTGSSIRDTQGAINACLGIDYNTFINSAFILQGRSSEFTRKKPTERKVILGRILNLDKYEKLADMARGYERKYDAEISGFAKEIDFYSTLLENKRQIRDDYETTCKELESLDTILNEKVAVESEILEELKQLDLMASELDSKSEALKQIEKEETSRKEEFDKIEGRIVGAERLLEQKEIIHQEYKRYISLQNERDVLDTNREIFRGLEKQIASVQADLLMQRKKYELKIEKADADLQAIHEGLTDVIRVLSAKPEVSHSLQEAKKASIKVKEYEQVMEQARSLKKKIEAQESQISKERQVLEGQILGLKKQYELNASQADDILALKSELGELESASVQLLNTQKQLDLITEEGQHIGAQVSQREGSLEQQLLIDSEMSQRILLIENNALDSCPTCGSEFTSEHRNQALHKIAEEKKAIQKRISQFRNEIESLSEKRNALRAKYKVMLAEVSELSNVAERKARLAERIITGERKNQENKSISAKISEIEATLRDKKYANEERGEVLRLMTELTQLDVDEHLYKKLQFEAAQVERYDEKMRSILFAEGKKGRLEEQSALKEKELVKLRNQLDNKEPFLPLNKRLAELEQSKRNCGFIPERFEEIKKELNRLSGVVDSMNELINAQERLLEWNEQIKSIKPILEEIAGRKLHLVSRVEELTKGLLVQDEVGQKLDVARRSRKAVEDQIRQSQLMKGELVEKISQIDENERKMKTAKSALANSRKELLIYKKLKTAFGKNGIQALLIEQSLPDLEERANKLLYQLTNGRMHVTLKTIKDKKTGGTKETLEIVITDEQGVSRPYETFSGGEAFRVDFSIRIALSQMLAERKGARVQTLGIDEGFGTQDEEGIQHLVDAIQKVQDEFDKIIVITHLNRLKDAFPFRIEVNKDPIEGSMLTYVE